jgi:hypothetical protein
MATDVGTGTTITFGTSSFAAEVLDINWDGLERGSIQTSHQGTTGYHTHKPKDLIEGGEITVDFHVDASATNLQPPIAAAPETITIAPGGDNDTFAFTGFVTRVSRLFPFEDKMQGSFTIKVADDVTHSVT